jgi:hypothetical protein
MEHTVSHSPAKERKNCNKIVIRLVFTANEKLFISRKNNNKLGNKENNGNKK